MNSIIASNINGGSAINQQIASGSRAPLLLSSIEFSLTEEKILSGRPASYNQGKYIMKLSGGEELLNEKIKNKTWDQNKNPIEKSINGNKSAEESIPIPKVRLFTGKIHVEWNQVHKIGAGLNNLGNTCFMNTVIQCLTYCPPLANYLLHDNDHISKCTITGFCMMCVLQRHMKRTIGKTGEVIKPLDVYQRLKLIAKHFQFGRQEDAHEFLRYVIDNLWKSCLTQNNGISKLDAASKETTVINKIFGGYHRSQVTCLRCKKESNTYDHFMDFILDIKQNVMSLEKALEKFTQPELLQQENCYKCPKCKMKVEAQKRFSVYWAPTVATFQLKRFDYNRSFGGKITKQITYPEKLNLRPYMSETQGDPVWYRLNAVLVHSGPSCNSGHYYCYVKNSNGFWYIMDDQRVHQVSLNQVLNQSAYVLFYIKIENGERVPLKKCLDNKNSFVKGVVTNSHIAKVPEVNSLKVVPLGEKISSFSNSKSFSPPNAVKKLNVSAPSREKVSFRIQPAAPFHSPKGRMFSPTAPGGLVPYVEDSSESSDASESNPSPSKVKVISEGEGLKNGVLESYNSLPSLEIKAKLSKSVFNHSSHSVTSNSVPKVSATSSWTVTDATETASSSSSSICGVNSTTDWHVINTVDVKSNNSVKSSDTNATESCGVKKLQIEKSSSEHLSRVNGNHLSPSNKLTQSESSPLAQNGNFRKHTFKPHFLENQETTENPFKRKSCDSHSKISTDSPHLEHAEGRYSPLSKKAKYTEKFVARQNGAIDSNVETFNKDVAEHRQFSTTQCDSGSRTCNVTSPYPDMPLHRNFSSSQTPEREDSSLLRGKHKERNGYPESSKFLQNENTKSPMSNQEKNTSLYGTEVPTWREENLYRPSVVPSQEHRRSFDDYDNELDRGKVRKFKQKDSYQYFRRKNPFQKHAERYHNKYNGKFYNNQNNHRKSYDSHYNWKPNRNDSYHRYRNHHQRRY